MNASPIWFTNVFCLSAGFHSENNHVQEPHSLNAFAVTVRNAMIGHAKNTAHTLSGRLSCVVRWDFNFICTKSTISFQLPTSKNSNLPSPIPIPISDPSVGPSEAGTAPRATTTPRLRETIEMSRGPFFQLPERHPTNQGTKRGGWGIFFIHKNMVVA